MSAIERVADVFGSFRGRLIATVIVLIGVTAGAVGVVSYLLVRNSLRAELVDDSVSRAEFNIAVLASPDQLASDSGREEFEATGLVDRFLLRGTGEVYVEFARGEPFASSLQLLAIDGLLSEELRTVVASGAYGYEFLTLDETPTLVVAGRRPPDGPDFYFFYSAGSVANALATLQRLLALAGIGVLALGALGAGLIARRVLRPVARAGEAAGVMAAGDLSVRLPAGTNDELGSLAVAFNQMAVSLEGQITALRQAHDRERRFVADVSHELRTPLTALVNEAAHLQGKLHTLPETDRRVGEMLVADVARLRVLVEDLLEISRLDSSAIRPDASRVDLAGFLEAVIEARNPAAELRLLGPVPSIAIDRRSLERIVGNLLDNARRHAPNVPVAVSARVEGGTLTVEVSDQGPGVPADALPFLFDRFYKTDEARRGGSGLGLAIARQHARRLGGDLTVAPVDPHGLAFTLKAPVADSLRSGDVDENLVSDPEGEQRHQARRTP